MIIIKISKMLMISSRGKFSTQLSRGLHSAAARTRRAFCAHTAGGAVDLQPGRIFGRFRCRFRRLMALSTPLPSRRSLAAWARGRSWSSTIGPARRKRAPLAGPALATR
eukprot:8210264-Pyramimonas_sp.AAC.1